MKIEEFRNLLAEHLRPLGIQDVLVDDFDSTSYRMFVVLPSVPSTTKRGCFRMWDNIQPKKVKQEIKKVANKYLYSLAISDVKPKYTTVSFLGRKERYFDGYDKNYFSLDVVLS